MKSENTEQLNLRMPKQLLADLETVSKILRVNKSEWIKIKLGEILYEEKLRLQDRYSTLIKNGILTKKELEELLKE